MSTLKKFFILFMIVNCSAGCEGTKLEFTLFNLHQESYNMIGNYFLDNPIYLKAVIHLNSKSNLSHLHINTCTLLHRHLQYD